MIGDLSHYVSDCTVPSVNSEVLVDWKNIESPGDHDFVYIIQFEKLKEVETTQIIL